jgi:tight adherence protein C
MLAAIEVFLLTTLVFFAVGMLFLRGGRNRDVLTRSGRRPILFGALTGALAGAVPVGKATRQRLATFLRHAGHYHRAALDEFLALRNVLVLGWLLLVVTFFAIATEPGDPWLGRFLLVGVIGTLILYAFPRLLLEATAKGRLQRIEEGLPDALDMITMCTSGGLPLPQAMLRVSKELQSTHADLATELGIVGRHMEMGAFEGAIKQFAKRIDTPDVQSLAAMIRQTDQQGASVAAAFEDFADNVRLARRQRAEEKGNKTAVKMLFPLVFCLAPPVYMMLLTPAVIELRDFVHRESRAGGALSASAESIAETLEQSLPDPRFLADPTAHREIVTVP